MSISELRLFETTQPTLCASHHKTVFIVFILFLFIVAGVIVCSRLSHSSSFVNSAWFLD